MNFEYSPDEVANHKQFEAFCAAGLADAAAPAGLDGRREALRANLTALGRQGYLGATLPVADGGLGATALAALPLHQAVARTCASTFAAAEASAFTVGGLLSRAGSAAQKAAWLPGLTTGARLGAFAVTEAEAGSDLGATATRAEPCAGGWTLTGAKVMVTNAPDADVALVLARASDAPGEAGLALFVVPTSAPGVRRGVAEATLGLQGAALGALELTACELPADALLGAVGGGAALVAEALHEGCLRYAAFSLGLAGACFELALEHATTRLQGGKPIFRHQEVSFKLADIYALTDTATQLTRHAAWAIDRREARAATLVLAAKLFAGEAVGTASNLALQIFGGKGYLAACPVERLVRDARYAELAKVSSELLRGRIAADVFRSVK